MGTYISDALRKLVRERAQFRCEYCLSSEEDAILPHEPDHVIAIKHGGETDALCANMSETALSFFKVEGTEHFLGRFCRQKSLEISGSY